MLTSMQCRIHGTGVLDPPSSVEFKGHQTVPNSSSLQTIFITIPQVYSTIYSILLDQLVKRFYKKCKNVFNFLHDDLAA